jgi:hypothetical protein
MATCADVAAAQITQTRPAELYRVTVPKKGDVTQTTPIDEERSISETSSWSDSVGVKVGVSTTFAAQIPGVGGSKVKLSLDASKTYTWGGSTTTTKTWGFTVPVSVPPHSTYDGPGCG